MHVGMMTCEGFVWEKVNFQPKKTATLGAFNWQGYHKPSFLKAINQRE